MTKVSAPQPEKIGVREFARRDGCDEKRVRTAIETKHLQTDAAGKLDAAMVGTGWRQRNRRAADTLRTKVRTPAKKCGQSAPEVSAVSVPAASLEETAERILEVSGAVWTHAEAERVKENYLALLRKLEYEQKAGSVVAVEDVAELVGKDYARVRTRLLAIPAENAPQLARIKHPAEMQAELYRLIAAGLEELTQDGPGAAGGAAHA